MSATTFAQAWRIWRRYRRWRRLRRAQREHVETVSIPNPIVSIPFSITWEDDSPEGVNSEPTQQ